MIIIEIFIPSLTLLIFFLWLWIIDYKSIKLKGPNGNFILRDAKLIYEMGAIESGQSRISIFKIKSGGYGIYLNKRGEIDFYIVEHEIDVINCMRLVGKQREKLKKALDIK